MMSIKMRLYGGFGVLVVLALSLALYAVVQFGGIGSNVGRLDYFAGTSTRTLQIQDFIEQMRRSALRYLYDHDETMRTEYEGIAVQMVATVDKAEQLSISEERKKEYRDIKAQFAVTQESQIAVRHHQADGIGAS